MDYNRLGLEDEGNIYHYVTRDSGEVTIQETAYPLIDISKVEPVKLTDTSFLFKDDLKQYKYTFGDSQIWRRFGDEKDSTVIDKVRIHIMDDPFTFLKDIFGVKHSGVLGSKAKVSDSVYLPLYSYNDGKVPMASQLNAWNGKPKNKNSNKPRPEAEVYIPIPKAFLKKYPRWFDSNIDFTNYKKYKESTGESNYSITLHLPDGTEYPAFIGQEGFKALQTNPQSALGKWLLYNVLGLKKGQPVTNDILRKAGFDSVRIWHKDPKDHKNVWIDFAKIGSFEMFMNGQLQDNEDDIEQYL